MDAQKLVNGSHSTNREDQPYRIRLPKFIVHEDIGLGDVIKRVIHKVGIRPRTDCGCGRRAAELNRRVVFSRKR